MLEAVVCLIFNSDGEAIGVSRKDNKDIFGLPGGKIELGETKEQAIAREVFEETGILLKGFDYLFSAPEGEYYVHCFVSTDYVQLMLPKEEGVVEWLKPSELIGDKGSFPVYNLDALYYAGLLTDKQYLFKSDNGLSINLLGKVLYGD
jgi:8-oxo-dGTP pyrophosphatase MutT (NUDIX family)